MFNIFKKCMSKEELAAFLKTDSKALEEFEKAYTVHTLNFDSDNLFDWNAKQAAGEHEGVAADTQLDDLINRIVDELLYQTKVLEFDGKSMHTLRKLGKSPEHPVTNAEINALPEELRSQLTGNLMKKDSDVENYPLLLDLYRRFLQEKDPKRKRDWYCHFRRGLDILDLDPVMYEMLGMNLNAMGYWFPPVVKAAVEQGFFRVPKTTIIKVPLSMLQLTRLEYASLTRTTLDIIDLFCQKVFQLDETEEYFIKTGTYSSKYDFRNAHVHGEKEVRELGEYLIFIQNQACIMAGPLTQPSFYGVSTTNEWVVREFIKDSENNPHIYKGLPLHTEYRLFLDFDTKEILGMNPYWDPNLMEERFGRAEDANSPHNIHDYVIYQMHEKTLMGRYEQNKDMIKKKVQDLLPLVEGLSGQWSLDIMQNGNDFWLIDMALADNSALKECVPKGLLKSVEENWIPVFPGVEDTAESE